MTTRLAQACLVAAACASSLACSRGAPAGVSATLAPQPDLPAFDAADGLLVPGRLLSRGRPVFGRSLAHFATPRNAIDGDDSTSWAAGRPTDAEPAWLAVDIGTGPSRVVVSWRASGSFNYEETDYGSPGAYRLETSSDSTNGDDGSWTEAADVPHVGVHAQLHALGFGGKRWVRMVITATPDPSPNGVQLTEFEVHDASRGASDTWFFAGDSITAFACGQSPRMESRFAELIAASHPLYHPATICGGTGGAMSGDGAAKLDSWLARNEDARVWALAFGTNDAAGDSEVPAAFRANLESMVTRLERSSRIVMIATIPFSSDGHHRHIADFNTQIEQVRAGHSLLRGPDLYSWFAAHPDELRDGIHPGDRGIASINRLWAEAAAPLYRR